MVLDLVPNAHMLDILFERSAECLLLLDPSGEVVLINASGVAALGLENASRSVGRNWIAFWQEGPHREAARAAVAEAAAGRFGECRSYLAAFGGGSRWWHTVITPVPDHDGRITHLLATSRDVSDEERLARDLDAAATRMTAPIEASSETVWESGAEQDGFVVVQQTAPGQVASRRTSRADWLSQMHPDDRTRVEAASRHGREAGTSYAVDYRLRRPGAFRWMEDRAIALRDHEGRLVGWVGVVTDIHDRVLADQALRGSEERLRLALTASQVGIWDLDVARGDRRWSDDLKAILGLPAHVAESKELLFSLIVPEDRPAVEVIHQSSFVNATTVAFRVKRADTGELRWILSSGRAIIDASGRPFRCLGTFQDITERKLIEEQLWRAANRDALTGLPNRTLFHTKLEQAIEAAKAGGTRVGLIVIDIDHFKEVNDTLGHDAGDAVLRLVADRLESACPAPATVARLGGDEFAVLIPGRSLDKIAAAAADLVVRLARPMPYGEAVLTCSGSLGLAVFPDHDRDSGELLKNADLALYAAKRSGRSCHGVFDTSMKVALQKRVAVLRRARDALAHCDLVPYYQPKVGARGGAVGGFEALMRWREAGVLYGPGDLEEAFADPELAAQIGDRMLDLVIADLVAWQEAGVAVGSIAVNVAAAEFTRVDVAQRWLSALAAAKLPASALQMEVTETVFLGEASDAVGQTLHRVHAGGIQIALDDFGTGFASLTHLRSYPVDWLKIDQSFIHDLADDSGARAIISGVIDLAHGIGLRVVAEGVETAAQSAILASKGCELLQGFLIAKPMAASRVAHFLATWAEQGGRQQARRVAGRRG